MSFSKIDLDNIKSKISIRSELEKKTKLTQKGKDYWCCCPFHEEKTPSCKINDDYGSFYCFGCGAKGDIFTIYTDLYNYNFIDAVKELSQRAGIKINFESDQTYKNKNKIEEILKLSCLWFQENLNHSSANICNEYLIERKLKKETIKKFKLGYSYNKDINLYKYLKSKLFSDEEILESNVAKLDKNKKIRDFFYKRLIFPICNIQGKIVGFGGRSLDGSNPKYINSPESNFFQKRYLLYNLNIAKEFARKKNNLLICEGYMDIISLNQNGIYSVVAPLGTALTEEQLHLAWKYSSKPTIMFDGDNSGIRASYKVAIMALSLISANKYLQFISLPSDIDPDKYINEYSLKNFLSILKNPDPLSHFIFNQSIKSVSLNKVDEKISYDKYLDDLVDTIKDKKSQYFYKNEFKSLFFNNIRTKGKKEFKYKLSNKEPQKNLNKVQNLSFIATILNHPSVRNEILIEFLKSDLFNKDEKTLLNELKNERFNKLENKEILKILDNQNYIKIVNQSLTSKIYKLFPYSSPNYDPQLSRDEALNSLNNLNTRLLNLQKINKSLDTFIKESNQLNWEDLQKINIEITNED